MSSFFIPLDRKQVISELLNLADVLPSESLSYSHEKTKSNTTEQPTQKYLI